MQVSNQVQPLALATDVLDQDLNVVEDDREVLPVVILTPQSLEQEFEDLLLDEETMSL